MKKVLITGAGTGFGNEAALRLAEKGFHVIAAVEIYAQVMPLKRHAAKRGVTITVEKLDVTNEGDRKKALAWDVEILVNNAGMLEGGSVVDVPGANLVAVIAQKANKEGIVNRIKLQIMNGLPIDGRPENLEKSVSYQENATGYMQTKAASYFSIENYAPGDLSNNPEASPIITKDLRGLPPAVIINAEFDPLRDDRVLYAAKLKSFSVRVWDKCFPGQIHCLLGLPQNSAEIKEYHNIILTAMEESFKK